MGIRILNLKKIFNKKEVLRVDSFETKPYGVVTLSGPNGSGKSTLLKIISTLLTPTDGDVWVNEVSVMSNPRKVRQMIGFVQATDGGFLRKLSGRKNLELFGKLRGLSQNEIDRCIDQWNPVLNLDQVLQLPFAALSSGMKQSLSVCRALLHNPPVLLLDEPTRGLDPEKSAKLERALGEICTEKLIFVASHHPLNNPKEVYSGWRLDSGAFYEVTESIGISRGNSSVSQGESSLITYQTF